MRHSARFLDILTDPVAWATRHGIEPFEAPCPGCGVTVRTTIPIARGALRGLRAPDCACGYSLGRMPYGVVTNTKPLTPRQREVLEILIRTTEDGCQASKREMGFALGVGSTNAISGHMLCLERDGYIRNRGDNKSRSVAILRNPDGSEYLSPKQRIEALVEALGCTGQSFGEALAVARSCGQRGETEFDEHAEPHPMGER